MLYVVVQPGLTDDVDKFRIDIDAPDGVWVLTFNLPHIEQDKASISLTAQVIFGRILSHFIPHNFSAPQSALARVGRMVRGFTMNNVRLVFF